MRVEFVFDTICPWCYVGAVRLVGALSSRPDYRVAIRWTPFILNPDMPYGGADRQSYLERKFGGASRVHRLNTAVTETGRGEGIVFDFDRIKRTPNSLHSHRLIKFAARFDKESQAGILIFKSYFTDGIDIGRIEDLIALGERLGLPQRDLADYLYSDADFAAVVGDNARAHRLGVNGVPSMIFNDRFAISGAQETVVLRRLLDLASEDQTESVSS